MSELTRIYPDPAERDLERELGALDSHIGERDWHGALQNAHRAVLILAELKVRAEVAAAQAALEREVRNG